MNLGLDKGQNLSLRKNKDEDKKNIFSCDYPASNDITTNLRPEHT